MGNSRFAFFLNWSYEYFNRRSYTPYLEERRILYILRCNFGSYEWGKLPPFRYHTRILNVSYHANTPGQTTCLAQIYMGDKGLWVI